jgi:hypothetical protein
MRAASRRSSTLPPTSRRCSRQARALHAREDDSDAPNRLARAAIELRETTGQPVAAIIEATRAPDVAALVLGVRGVHGGPQPAGSTALDVITRVAEPVVVAQPHTTRPGGFRRVLVPLEGPSESSRPLAATIERGIRADIEIIALHVHSPASLPAFSDHAHHETPAWEREFIARFVQAAHEGARLICRMGVAADDVGAVARDADADLIALAWSQDLGPGHARVVRETLARCPGAARAGSREAADFRGLWVVRHLERRRIPDGGHREATYARGAPEIRERWYA